MTSVPTKTCTRCGLTKPITEMESLKKGDKIYARTRCKKCGAVARKAWAAAHPEQREAQNIRKCTQDALQRRTRESHHLVIYRDAKASDSKHNREFSLTTQQISALIEQGCCYCGETTLRMTLERIDNGLGHTLENVVPACLRCNYIRRDMPHRAWLQLVKGLRVAREAGLFGEWTGNFPRVRATKQDLPGGRRG